MPPKARTAKKRARSPDSNPPTADQVQTRSSKHAKKNASATSTSTTATAKSQAEKDDVVEDPRPSPAAAPSFRGNFDLYAMSLPFLNSVFAPKRDYAALLKTIRTYQAKPDNTARIFLPGPEDDAAKHGRFESPVVLDPLQEWPFDLALRSLTLKDALAFTARETSDAAQFFSDPPTAKAKAKAPGVAAAVALARDQCGISSSKGAFKMRRAWVSEDGKDEVFEGVFSVSIVYSSLYRSKCDESACRESFAFWAIRARVGEDEKEIGLGPGTGGGGERCWCGARF
ncbi:hypothetical protein V8D89_014377 [Ganoderma adspersum]